MCRKILHIFCFSGRSETSPEILFFTKTNKCFIIRPAGTGIASPCRRYTESEVNALMTERLLRMERREEDEARFFRRLDEAYARVDALFGEAAAARGESPASEAVLASLTAAAVLSLRRQCLRASFTLPRGTKALLSQDKKGGLCIRRRGESAGARG